MSNLQTPLTLIYCLTKLKLSKGYNNLLQAQGLISCAMIILVLEYFEFVIYGIIMRVTM
jgi:hypothetical protein